MKKKLTEDKIVDIVVYFLLTIIGIITVYPFYYTIICSLNDGMDLMKGGVYLFPRKFTLANYQLFLSDAEWTHAFSVSVAKTIIGTAMVVSMLPIMCVYPFLQKYFVQGMMIGAVKE